MADNSSVTDQQRILNPQPIGGVNYGDIGVQPTDRTMLADSLDLKDRGSIGGGNYAGLQTPTNRPDAAPSLASEMESEYNITPINTQQDKALAGAKLLQSGLEANQNSTPTTDVGSAAVQAGSTAISTGIAGATIGSVIPGVGTAVGGVVGLAVGAVIGGAQAYFNVANSRKQARKYELLRKEALARADAQRAQDMAISAEQTRYDRATAANQARVDQWNAVKSNIVSTLNNDAEMRKNFVKQGFN